MSYIRCNNIYKRYRDKQVLNGLSFECENEIAFLAGKNGAGKTTFIRIALGMDNATSGNIDFSHDGISGESRGAVFDTPCLYPYMTCSENIKILCTGYLRDKAHVKSVLESLRIDEELLRKKVGKCSFGQQHRVSVAVALIRKPVFFFLDEPTIGLDPVSWDLVRKSIIENREKQGGTVIITGQDYFEMATFSEKLIILDEGVSKYSGRTSDFLSGFSASFSVTTRDALPQNLLGKVKMSTRNADGSMTYLFSSDVKKEEVFHRMQTGKIEILNMSTQQISLKDAVYSVIDSGNDFLANTAKGSDGNA